MQPFDIVYAGFDWKDCKDIRPWLIIEKTPDGSFNCFPISGQDYRGRGAFELDHNDPDFAQTGLTKSCYIHDESFFSLPPTSFKSRKGALTGQLLTRFLAHAGLSHLQTGK
jgi:hypothetical protein